MKAKKLVKQARHPWHYTNPNEQIKEAKKPELSQAEMYGKPTTWTPQTFELITEERSCKNCGTIYECPPSQLMLRATAHEGKVRQAIKVTEEIAAAVRRGRAIVVHTSVQTSVPVCRRCTINQDPRQLNFFEPNMPNLPRQFLGDQELSGQGPKSSTAKPEVKAKPKAKMLTLDDF